MPLRPSFDKRPLLPLLSAFFPTLCVFLLSLDISLLPFALSVVFSVFCAGFSLSAEMLSLLSSGDFLCFSLFFFCFLCFSSSGDRYACVSDFYSRFIVQMYVDCYRQHESKYDDEQYIYENKPAHKPSVSVWCADGTPIRVSAGVIGLFLKAVIRNKIAVLL